MADLKKTQPKNEYSHQIEKNLLQRLTLHGLLEEATLRQAVLVVAGPGYGKSTAVSSFLADKKSQTVWISLTPSDNVDSRMWRSFWTAFCSIQKETDGCLLNIGAFTSNFAFENFIEILAEELDETKRYYLVLDDFHTITTPSIPRFVEKIILARIPNLCVILISRRDPLMSTVSLLSKNLLFRIDDGALRLTKDEMSRYFHQQGIVLMEQAVSEFYEYTAGWFFATHLVCLSLEKGKLYQKNPLSAVELDIFSLLETEVYTPLPLPLKNLLLKLSLLESLPIELAAHLADGQEETVNQILSISSFIVFDGFTRAIRIHPLFLDFLRKKHDSLSIWEKNKLHLQAAGWYEQNEYRIDAISHYEKVGNYDRIINILLTFNKAYPTKTMDFLQEVIGRIPDPLLKEKPIVRFLSLKFMMNNFHVEEVNRKLLELRKELELLPPTPEIQITLGEIYLHLAFQSMITVSITHTYEFVDYFKMAHKYLPEGSKLTYRPYISSGNYVCNISSHTAGEVDSFITAVKRMLPYGIALLPGTYEGYGAVAEAELAYFRKDAKLAEKHIQQALREAHDGQSLYVEIYSLFLQVRLSVAAGDYKKTVAALDQQKQLVKQANTPEGYAVCDITSGWFHAQLGHTAMVPEWIQDEAQSREVLTPVTFAADKLVRARCLLNDNEIYELLALLGAKSQGFAFESFLFGSIEMKVLKAIALNLIRDFEASAEALREAYELAAPNKIIMPFVENGKYTRTLIKRVAPYTKLPAEWLEDVQTKATTYGKRLSNFSAEFSASRITDTNKPCLSRRETQVLLSLCQNLTREEIANAYGLSVNTVKSLVNGIHNKLGVNSNIDAVRVATQLNLL